MITSFLIEENEIKAAQHVCNDFKNIELASSSAASCMGAILTERFFQGTNFEVDAQTGLYRNEEIAHEFELSDVYINGNFVNTRIYFNEKELCVPKSHFDNEIVPLAYMFIKLSSDLTNAEIMGFLLPDMITRIDDVDGYYQINENALIPFEEIDYMFKEQNDTYNIDDEEIFSFLDNKCDDKLGFVKKLLLSKDGRSRLLKAYKAQAVLAITNISQKSQDVHENKLPEPEVADFADLITIPEIEPEENSQENLLEEAIIETVPVADTVDEEIVDDNIPSNEIEEYGFSTVASPKFNEEGSPQEVENDEFAELERDIEATDAQINHEELQNQESEEIANLFSENEHGSVQYNKKKSSPILPILLVLLIFGGAGYYGYTKFFLSQNTLPSENLDTTPLEQVNVPQKQEEAMPVETVEKKVSSTSKNEGNAVSIPAIEKNLDASILVSNLAVEWDVPSGYKTNTQAIRYLTKMGKIIRLNLTSELLLLNKPPISNKISIELKYDNVSKSFEVVDFINSSGEKDVDDIIMQTVKKTLGTKLSINTDTFGKLSGNPVIVIKF